MGSKQNRVFFYIAHARLVLLKFRLLILLSRAGADLWGIPRGPFADSKFSLNFLYPRTYVNALNHATLRRAPRGRPDLAGCLPRCVRTDGRVVKQGCLRAGCAGWPLYASLCLNFWTEFRGIPLATELRFSFEATPVTNKRTTNARGKGQLGHATPPSWRGCTAVSLPVSLFLPSSCADTCLTKHIKVRPRTRSLSACSCPPRGQRSSAVWACS